ncbi:MAG: undecaprenyl-diphosphate phosphatase [Spirochaetes bacterium]|nr:undecaprenyl-diphosphate phosphatase [Spirochaetota bacterium]
MPNILITLIILGIVQGIAEFLPISSSGHLVIFENIGFFKNTINSISENSELFINVILHIATLLAVVIYLWKDIVNIAKGSFTGILKKEFKNKQLIIMRNIILASIPAGIIGLLFHDFFENAFSSANIAFTALIINGFILLSTKIIPLKSRKLDEIGVISFFIGIFQALAIIPGISRSGMTITGGMLSGLAPEESAKFSFLMAIPVIAGAGLLESFKAFSRGIPTDLIIPLVIAMAVTLIVALISLKVLFYLVKKLRIDVFGYYTILIGILGLLFF